MTHAEYLAEPDRFVSRAPQFAAMRNRIVEREMEKRRKAAQ